MIHEPEICCECDKCQDTILINPAYGYIDYTGNKGAYLCSDSEIRKQLKSEGWIEDNDKDICPDCQAESVG